MGCSPHLCKESTPMGHGVALPSADVSVEARLSHDSFVIMSWNFGWAHNSLHSPTGRKTSIFPASKVCIITRKIKKVTDFRIVFCLNEIWNMHHLGRLKNHTFPAHLSLSDFGPGPIHFRGLVWLKGWWVWYPLMLAISACEKCGQWRHAMLCFKTWALFPMGFGWVLWGVPPMLLCWACCPRIALQRKSTGLPLLERWKEFPSWFLKVLKFKVSNHHIPKKKRCRSCEAKQKQYYVVVFFRDCLDIALFYKYIWRWAIFCLGGGGPEKVFKKPATAFF